MLIIVEGPPCAGKSTFTFRLQQALVHTHQGADIAMRGDGYLNHYLRRLEEYTPGTNEHIICDEWHWALPAYASVFSASNPVQPGVLRYLDSRLAQLGAVVAYRNPSLGILERRLTRRNIFLHPQHRITQDLEHIQAAYTALSDESLTTVLPPAAKLSNVIQTAQYVEKQATPLATKHPLYVGSAQPQALLVDMDPDTYETLPPINHTGASYLHKALALSAPDNPRRGEEALGMVNAAYVTQTPFAALLKTLGQPKLIALGHKASAYLSALTTAYPSLNPHTLVPHPSKARRTYGAYALEYGQLLRGIASAPTPTAPVNLLTWDPRNTG